MKIGQENPSSVEIGRKYCALYIWIYDLMSLRKYIRHKRTVVQHSIFFILLTGSTSQPYTQNTIAFNLQQLLGKRA